MKRTIVISSLMLIATVLPTITRVADAEEIYLLREGNPIEQNMQQTDIDPVKNPFWEGWKERKGQTVNGVFVLDKGPKNRIQFAPIKSALGDCEFTIVFRTNLVDYKNRGGGRGPFIFIKDRGRIGGWSKGSEFIVWNDKMTLPLTPFKGPASVDINDGKLHTMSVKRVGDVLTFTVDGKKINEQKIDPEVNLIFEAHPLESRPDFAMIKMTAEKFSPKLETQYKSAAPITTLFDGAGDPQETVTRQSDNNYSATWIKGRNYAPNKSAVYRIPALVVTRKGTLLAFAEARASKFDWGNIRLVVKRSEDNGKTWGPEIDTSKGKFPDHKNGNPVPIVDHETGRIFLINHRNPSGRVHAGDQRIVIIHSDDDGMTWSDARSIPMAEWLPEGFNWMLTGPGHGIQLRQGQHKGRLIVPCYGEGSGYVVYSDDHGKTWTVGAASPSGPYNEATCVELLGGDVMLNMRSPGGRGERRPNRGSAVLTRGGSEFKDGTSRFISDLPCPSCQGGTTRFNDPKGTDPGIILFAGPGLSTVRGRGTLFASYDNGKTWPWKKLIYEGPYGYSDIAVLPNGKIACIFELNKQDLIFTVFNAQFKALPR